jgi:hypothetical protein
MNETPHESYLLYLVLFSRQRKLEIAIVSFNIHSNGVRTCDKSNSSEYVLVGQIVSTSLEFNILLSPVGPNAITLKIPLKMLSNLREQRNSGVG